MIPEISSSVEQVGEVELPVGEGILFSCQNKEGVAVVGNGLCATGGGTGRGEAQGGPLRARGGGLRENLLQVASAEYVHALQDRPLLTGHGHGVLLRDVIDAVFQKRAAVEHEQPEIFHHLQGRKGVPPFVAGSQQGQVL